MAVSALKAYFQAQGWHFDDTTVTQPSGLILPFHIEQDGRKKHLYLAARDRVESVAFSLGRQVSPSRGLSMIQRVAQIEPTRKAREQQERGREQQLALIEQLDRLLAPYGVLAQPAMPEHPGLILVSAQGKCLTTLRHDLTNFVLLDRRGHVFAELFSHPTQMTIDWQGGQWLALHQDSQTRRLIPSRPQITILA